MEGMMEARTPETWYRSLPPLTRALLTSTFIITVLATFGILSPIYLILDWRSVVKGLQFWRLLTNLMFYGPFSFPWLMHMYFLVSFSSKLEVNEMFTASPGAYMYFLIFQAISLDLLSLLVNWPSGLPLLGQGLCMAVMYYWSRREPFSTVSFWGFQIQAYQFPFILLFIDLLMGHSIWVSLMGLATGHVYYFLKDVLPQEKGIDLLVKTPSLCDELMVRAGLFDISNIMGSLKILLFGRHAQPPRVQRVQQAPVTRTLFSGEGYRLGGSVERRAAAE